MPRPTVSRISRIFLDSSVVMAGILRDEGGSGALLYAIELGLLNGFISQQVIDEVSRNLENKGAKGSVKAFQRFLAASRIETLPNPSRSQINRATMYIHPKDAPILATCLNAKIDYLVTLDVRDFGPIARKTNFSFGIVAPKTVLELI